MEKDTAISTNRLFHYTNKKEILISILTNGFKPQFSFEKLGIFAKESLVEAITKEYGVPNDRIPITDNGKLLSDELYFKMCCFCDIPLNLVESHKRVYGNYSIGLTKEWGESQSICPVMYVPQGGETCFLFDLIIKDSVDIKPIIEQMYNQKSNDEKEELAIRIIKLISNMYSLTMFIKPYIGYFEKKGFKDENYKFYDEREWRYIPNRFLGRQFLHKNEYDNPEILKTHNESTKNISFEFNDITDIIVPESEVKEFRDIVSNIDRLKHFDLSKIDTIENRIKKTSL